MGEVIQLQGDQRKDVQEFLVDKKEGLELDAKTIKVLSFSLCWYWIQANVPRSMGSKITRRVVSVLLDRSIPWGYDGTVSSCRLFTTSSSFLECFARRVSFSVTARCHCQVIHIRLVIPNGRVYDLLYELSTWGSVSPRSRFGWSQGTVFFLMIWWFCFQGREDWNMAL